ncbi:MAG: hypothetical protein QNK43_09815 [Amphritea sp.]|nr:hypothetical protein [Amphritea sp.]
MSGLPQLGTRTGSIIRRYAPLPLGHRQSTTMLLWPAAIDPCLKIIRLKL